MLFIYRTVRERGPRSGSAARTATGPTRGKSTFTKGSGITSRTPCRTTLRRDAFMTRVSPKLAASTRRKELIAMHWRTTTRLVETLTPARLPLGVEPATKGEVFTLWSGQLAPSRCAGLFVDEPTRLIDSSRCGISTVIAFLVISPAVTRTRQAGERP